MLPKKSKSPNNISQLTLFDPPKAPMPPTSSKQRKRGRPKKTTPTITYVIPQHIIERRITLDKLERDAQLLISYEANRIASAIVNYQQAKENFNRSWNKALEQGYTPADLFAIMRKV